MIYCAAFLTSFALTYCVLELRRIRKQRRLARIARVISWS